jgi:hypothetical protein
MSSDIPTEPVGDVPGVTTADEEVLPASAPASDIASKANGSESVLANPTRDQIRQAILDSKPETEKVVFNGVLVELHQPSLEELLNVRAGAEDDNKRAVVSMIITYCYVPGTNMKVFEETDYDSLLSVPFGKGMSTLLEGFTKLTGVDVTDADKRKAEGR